MYGYYNEQDEESLKEEEMEEAEHMIRSGCMQQLKRKRFTFLGQSDIFKLYRKYGMEMDDDIAEDAEAFEQEKAALESLGYKIDNDEIRYYYDGQLGRIKEKVINTTCRTLVFYINFAKSKDKRAKI